MAIESAGAPPAPDPHGAITALATPGPDKVTIRVILSDSRVRIVLLTIFVIMLGFGIIAPVLPLFAQSYGVGYDAVGLLIASFAFTRLLMDPFAGPLVDRFGERRSAAAGVAFVGISSILTGLAPTFTMAVILRGAGGAGSSVLFAALYSSFLKLLPADRRGRGIGIFSGMFNVGLIAGQPFGGLIVRVFGTLASPLYVYGALLLMAGGLVLLYTQDMPRAADPGGEAGERLAAERDLPMVRRAWAVLRELCAERAFVTSVVGNFAGMWVTGAVWLTLIPLFGHDRLGLSPAMIGALLSVSVATELVVLYPAGGFADRRGRRTAFVASMVAYALIVVVVGLTGTVLGFALALAALGLASGIGAVVPTAMLGDVVPEHRTAVAVGVFRTAGDLGFVLGPLAAGAAASAFGFEWAFVLSAIPMALTALLGALTPETLRRPVPA